MRLPSGTTDLLRCSDCEQMLPPESFGRDRGQSRGRKYRCKPCEREHRIAKYDPSKNRDQYLRRKYGISLTDYDRMLDEQHGLCAICQEPGEKRSGGSRAKDSLPLYVDHDHVTGDVRGLLCHKCNVALGLFFDDPSRIDRAAKYIRGLHPKHLRLVKCV